jgi:hypothetical protein
MRRLIVAASNVESSIIEVDRIPLKRSVSNPSIIDLPTNVVADSGQTIQPDVSTTERRSGSRGSGSRRQYWPTMLASCNRVSYRISASWSHRRTTK